MAILALLVLLLPAALRAAEEHGEDHPSNWTLKRTLNFGACFVILYALLGRPVRNFFRQRAGDIRGRLEEALSQRQRAEAQLAEVRARFEGLQRDLQALRAQAEEDARGERERMVELAQSQARELRGSLDRLVATETTAALAELRRYAAELAVELAEARLREQYGPAHDAALLRTRLAPGVEHD